jgi:hypothetical protein
VSLTERLALLVTADTTNAVTHLDKLGKASETSLSGLDKLKGAFGSLGSIGGLASIAGASAALGTAVKLGIDFAKAAEEDARGQKLLETTIRNTTAATVEQISGTDDYIKKLSLASTVIDDQLRPALATIVRSTGDLGTAQKVLSVALDVSAGTGKDLGSVSEALSKAIQGNTKSLKLLAPELGTLIKDGASANEILAALSRIYKGQAADFANNNSFGKLAIAAQEAKETLGTAFLPVVQATAKAVHDDLGPALENAKPLIDAMALSATLLGKEIGLVGKSVSFLAGLFPSFGSGGSDAAKVALEKPATSAADLSKGLQFLQSNLGSLPPFFQGAARAALGTSDSLHILGTDADGLAAKLAALSFSGVESQMFGNVEAQAKFNSTIDGFNKVTATAGTSAKDYEKKLRSIEDAERSLADAQQGLSDAQVNLFLTSLGSTSDEITRSQIAERESTRSLADAQRALGDAQKRLNDLRNVDAASALDAQANYIQAQRDFVDAERSGDVVALDRAKAALIRTQEALNKAQDPSIGVDVAKAQQDVQAAQDGVTRAALDQKQAQQDLNDVLDAGKKGSKELGDANKKLEDAQRKVEDASRSLGDAQDGLITSTGGVTGATKDSTTKFYEGLTAASSYLEYLRNNKAPADEIAKAIGEIETKLGGVASEAGKTGEFDAYIGKLRDVQGAYDDLNRTIDNGPWSGHQGPNGGNMFPPTPNDLARSAAGDVGIGISVTVKGTGVVDALLDYQSKNGSVPIRVSG